MQTISNRLEELLNQAVVRWQVERPTSPFEVKYPKEHKDLKNNNIIRTPQKEKPRLKVVQKKLTKKESRHE